MPLVHMNRNIADRRERALIEQDSAGTSDPIWLGIGDAQSALVEVSPGSGGSAKVQVTGSAIDKVEADEAIWSDWPEGSVEVPVAVRLRGPVSAVRLVSTTEPAAIQVMR